MSETFKLIVSCILAYLLGSVSGGIILSKIGHGPDLHTVGSKSTGASNVQRTMGWKYGLLTFFFDAGKGLLACWLAQLITGTAYDSPLSNFASLLAGLFQIPWRQGRCHHRRCHSLLLSCLGADFHCADHHGNRGVQIYFRRQHADGHFICGLFCFLCRREPLHHYLGGNTGGYVHCPPSCEYKPSSSWHGKQARP